MSKNKNVEMAVGCILMVLGGLGLFLLAVVLNSMALVCLWFWYIVPLGVKPIGMIHALGLSVFISFMRGSGTIYKNKKKFDWAANCCLIIIFPILSLFFGWIIHFFL